MTETLDRSADLTPAALDQIARINSLLDVAWQVAELLDAQLMEALWRLRRELPDERRFRSAVGRWTRIDPERAVEYASTWGVARNSRPLRELATREPMGAIDLVKQVAETGVRLEDAADDEVVKILSLPPKARHRSIRRLVQAAEAEVEEAEPVAPAKDDAHRLTDVESALRRIAGELVELRLDAAAILLRGVSARSIATATRQCDSVGRALESMEALLMGANR